MMKTDEILRAVYRKDMLAIEKLTPQSVNIRNGDGRTPLMHAILDEDGADPLVIKALINRGADVNAIDSIQKWTPLHFVARDQNVIIVRILLEEGAEVDPVNVFGNTPLMLSVTKSTSSLAVPKELIMHYANPHRKNNYGVSPIDLARTIGRSDLVSLFESKA